jgi:hypothetical protein
MTPEEIIAEMERKGKEIEELNWSEPYLSHLELITHMREWFTGRANERFLDSPRTGIPFKSLKGLE